MNTEIANYLKNTPTLRSFILNIKFFLTVARVKAISKIYKKPAFRYPKRARPLIDMGSGYQVLQENSARQVIVNFPFHFHTSLYQRRIDAPFYWADLKIQEIRDSEVVFSINRWYWMLYDNQVRIDTTNEKLVALSKLWIYANRYNPVDVAWEPYSTSERLSSFTTTLLLKNTFSEAQGIIKTDKTLRDFVSVSIHHLSTHLEYYPEDTTFNHVANDLKGIITAAILLDDQRLLNKSIDLLLTELDVLIDGDGFLREGSSHYQLIFTRWIIDLMFTFRKAEKLPEVDKFAQISQRLVNASLFFIVEGDPTGAVMPLFGDISPDFDPEWITEYFRSALISEKADQSVNYGDEVMRVLNFTNKFAYRCNYLSKTNYTRINHGPWILFVSHSANEGSFYPNHAHEDFTSYVIYLDGKELVVDPGRHNYHNPPLRDQFCQSDFHNVIQIDNLPIAVSKNHFYLPSHYKKTNASVAMKVDNEQISLIVNVDRLRFSGKKKAISYSRTFMVSITSIDVHDHIKSDKELTNISAQIFLSGNYSINIKIGDNLILTNEQGSSIELQTSQPFEFDENFCRSERYNSTTKLSKLYMALQFRLVGNISVRYLQKSP